MTRRKITTAILISISIIWTAAAWAFNEPDEFMSVKWGTSCEDARLIIEKRLSEKSKERKGGTTLANLDPRKNGNLSKGCGSGRSLGSRLYDLWFHDIMGKAVVNVILIFLDNKFESVRLYFKADSYPGVAKAFSTKYGEPDAKENSIVKNQKGAESENQKLMWKGKQIKIVMRKFTRKGSNGDAQLFTQRWLDYWAERKKEVKEKAVKDF